METIQMHVESSHCCYNKAFTVAAMKSLGSVWTVHRKHKHKYHRYPLTHITTIPAGYPFGSITLFICS